MDDKGNRPWVQWKHCQIRTAHLNLYLPGSVPEIPLPTQGLALGPSPILLSDGVEGNKNQVGSHVEVNLKFLGNWEPVPQRCLLNQYCAGLE